MKVIKALLAENSPADLLKRFCPIKSTAEDLADQLRYLRGDLTKDEKLADAFYKETGIFLGFYLLWLKEEADFLRESGIEASRQ